MPYLALAGPGDNASGGQGGLLGAAAISAIDAHTARSSPTGTAPSGRRLRSSFEAPLDSPEAPRRGRSSRTRHPSSDAPLRELPRHAPRDVGDLAPFRIATAIHAFPLREGRGCAGKEAFLPRHTRPPSENPPHSKSSLQEKILRQNSLDLLGKKEKNCSSHTGLRKQKRPLMLSRASTRASDEASRTVGRHTSPSLKYGCRGMPLPGWSGGAAPLLKNLHASICVRGLAPSFFFASGLLISAVRLLCSIFPHRDAAEYRQGLLQPCPG